MPALKPLRHPPSVQARAAGSFQDGAWVRADVHMPKAVFMTDRLKSMFGQGWLNNQRGKLQSQTADSSRKRTNIYAFKLPRGKGVRTRYDHAREVVLSTPQEMKLLKLAGKVKDRKLAKIRSNYSLTKKFARHADMVYDANLKRHKPDTDTRARALEVLKLHNQKLKQTSRGLVPTQTLSNKARRKAARTSARQRKEERRLMKKSK